MLVEDKNTKLIDGIRKAVKTFGSDFKYKVTEDVGVRNCVYFETDTECPSCLIGHGIAAAGYNIDSELVTPDSVELIPALELDNIRSCNAYSARHILRWLNFNPDIVFACSIGQAIQDAGDTWGEALEVIHDSLVDSGVADRYWR